MFYKNIFDFIFSLLGLIIISPVILIIIISLIISYKSTRIFFIQNRIGKNGNIFRIVKFRTMIINNFKNTISTSKDPRITPIGAFLRKYKLDELPELWNILKGDMSFVGPRPDVPGYADLLKGEERKILELRPGITGPASLKYSNEEEILSNVEDPIKYNNEVIFPDKVKINLDYFYNHNIFLDIKLILKTIFRSNY